MKRAILIAEDYEGVRILLRTTLGDTFPDYRLLEAKDGREAVNLAVVQRPDIVLMDIGLPQMSGIEATRQIKAALPEVQVLMVTNHEDFEHRAAAAAAGATGYILKKQIHTDLIPAVKALLSQPK
jgi:DNA-binding NarL/FixJ family response regulator